MSVASRRWLVTIWDRFWYAEARPASLAAFRILFAYCLWREVTTTYHMSVSAVDWNGYTLPYARLIPHMAPDVYEWVHRLQYPLIALVGLGLLMRVGCVGLLFLQGWTFFADQLNFRNHPYFFLLVLFVMLWSPADEALSVKALWRAWRRRAPRERWLIGPRRPVTFQRLIQLQVCIVYVYAALHKVHALYLDGGVLKRILTRDLLEDASGRLLLRLFEREAIEAFLERPEPWAIMSASVVVLELALPVLLWIRPARRVAIVVGIGFHSIVAFTMEIHVFSYAMIASYLLFLESETVPRVLRRAFRVRPSRTVAEKTAESSAA